MTLHEPWKKYSNYYWVQTCTAMESHSLTCFIRAWLIDQSKHIQVQLAQQSVVVGLHGRDKSEGPMDGLDIDELLPVDFCMPLAAGYDYNTHDPTSEQLHWICWILIALFRGYSSIYPQQMHENTPLHSIVALLQAWFVNCQIWSVGGHDQPAQTMKMLLHNCKETDLKAINERRWSIMMLSRVPQLLL